MKKVLEIKNLNNHFFHDFNLLINKPGFYTILGSNNSGKTYLIDLISSKCLTNNIISIKRTKLNKKNIKKYLLKIGLVKVCNKNSFIKETVLEELLYPLENLGIKKNLSKSIIYKILNEFKMRYIQDMKIKDLDYDHQQALLFIIALLHQPDILLIDDAINNLSKDMQNKIISCLKKKKKLTVLYFTNQINLDIINYIYLLNNYQIVKEGTKEEILEDEELLNNAHIEVPFMVDLSNKLKMYSLINKTYYDMEELVDSLWK